MKIRLTRRAIDQATYHGNGACFLWDTHMTGFCVRIYPSGRKSYVVCYYANGRQRHYTLGQCSKMTLELARKEALKVFLEVREGRDPAEARRRGNGAPTMADLAERHISEHAAIKNKPRSAKRARQIWDRCVIPKLGKRKVAEVQRADIARLMTSMAETPSMANKLLTQLSSAFNLAEVWGWRPEGTNPCRHVKRYKEESRERYLSESELRRLGEVLGRHEREGTMLPQAVAAIRLLIFTGCRSAEILNLKWDEVDFERKTLELQDSKTGRRTVILNSAALGVLDGLRANRGGEYVIPGRVPSKPLATLQKVWTQIRVEADIEDVRVHDLRHTHASFGVNHGQNLAVVGKLLGHSKIQTTQRYAHLADDPLRQASEQIGAGLAESLGS